jgi:cardiolipin synthase
MSIHALQTDSAFTGGPALREDGSAAQEAGYAWEFFTSPGQAWAAMYAQCREARASIDFEQYIFHRDRVGKRFLALFRRKARQGVRVRLIFDTFGSVGLYRSPAVRKLRAAGVQVKFFNPLNLLHLFMPWTWFPRTHAKTMLVDGRVLFTGGVCFSDKMRDWRDTQIRVEGPVSQAAQIMFDRHWHRPESASAPDDARAPFRFRYSRPLHWRNPIYRELRGKVRQARETVWMACPYFLPSRSFIRLLRRAVARGVDVRLLISEASDVRLADFVTLSYIRKLLECGLQIYLYRPAVFHGKVMVVDGWATVGSMNLDYLSAFRNRETNLMIDEPLAVAQLRRRFGIDFAASRLAAAQQWHALPLQYKLLGLLGRSFRTLL